MRGRDHIRLRSKREDNIKMYFKETGVEVVDWIHLAQDRDQSMANVNTVVNYRVP
jgi:hypothetical protein